MSDYIKREDAIGIVKNLKRFSCFGDDGFVQIPMVYCELMGVATADVAPVRHGMWVDVDSMQMHDLHGVLTWGNSFMCTECNFKTFAVEGHMAQYRYCPCCGARMGAKE